MSSEVAFVGGSGIGCFAIKESAAEEKMNLVSKDGVGERRTDMDSTTGAQLAGTSSTEGVYTPSHGG